MGVILDAKPRSAGSRTVFVCSEPPARPSRKLPTGVVLLAFSVLVGAVLIPPLGRHIINAGQTQLPASATSLVQFHRSLSGIDGQLDAANAKYRELSSSALHARNLLALFDATNGYEAALDGLYTRIISIDQPNSQNTETRTWARTARDLLVQRVTTLRSANHLMVKAVDSGEIDGVAVEAIERARASADRRYNDECAALRRGYEALGISREAIPSIPGSPR
jgi:hypothetical protein